MLVIALLLALAPTLTSCENHELDDPSIEEDALREYYYTQKFESMFGKIDPQHDWGFGVAGSNQSRSYSVNGNEWVNPPEVTFEEIVLVWLYLLQPDPVYQIQNPSYSSFYLTQVLGSEENYTTYNGDTVCGNNQVNLLSKYSD